MKTLENDGDPWTPVDASTTTVDVEPETPLEIKGGNVTAHINLGGDTTKEEEPAAEEEQAPTGEEGDGEKTSEEEADTATEVNDAEARLAEKLAALDAAKSGRKTRR